ncbi:MAG: branched-chain amino acid ABC transporter permease [Dehalococcoidia bacterium]
MDTAAAAFAAYLESPGLLAAPPWSDPSLFAQQVLSGIASGSGFAILALAIVLIYRSTSILNFAQGEMAMFSTFLAWTFMTRMDFWPAFFLAIIVAMAIGASLELFILRRVEQAPVLNSLIVTLGLFTMFNGLALWIWGSQPKGFGPFSVFSGQAVCVSDICIGRASLGILAGGGVIMVLLYALFQFTKVGLAMRATAQNRLASQLVGIPVGRMLTLGWALSAGAGAVAGLLISQNFGLTTSTFLPILLFAFAAAVVGGLDSPVGAIAGGLLIGVVRNMAGTYVPSDVGSVDLTVAFVVIVLVLMLRPTGIFGRGVARRV